MIGKDSLYLIWIFYYVSPAKKIKILFYILLKTFANLIICFFSTFDTFMLSLCSVPMDKEEKVVLDYSSDPLISDGKFQKSILASIAGVGKAIEDLYGSAQDIEGVVRDGKIYVVQTRPQM